MEHRASRSFGVVALGAAVVVVAGIGRGAPAVASDQRPRSEAAGAPGAPTDALVVARVAAGEVAATVVRVAASGGRVLAHLPGDALLVERGSLEPAAIAGVVAVEPWTPSRAISAELASLAGPGEPTDGDPVPIVVGLARASDLDAVSLRLGELGAQLRWADPEAAVPQLGLLVERRRVAEVVAALERLDGLAWADVQPPVRLLNGAAVWRCQSGIEGSTPLFEAGLDGCGQVVGIMDTGIDIDHCAFVDQAAGLPALNDHLGVSVHPDHRKVLAVDFYWQRDWPSPGPFDWDDHGHGSHVAGSVAGDIGFDGVHQGSDGMAPAARLVIQDGGFGIDDCADLPGLGCPVRPLEPMLQQAWDQGARIHSNSWGDEENFLPHNRYTERAADIDRFVWEHPEMAVFFAAGNAGAEGLDTVISPSTAKNVVAVGASWRADMEPPCVADWSSRGWTHDGRIKPDVVAPGSSVVSVASDRTVSSHNCGYVASSGTSMATPVVAGLAALVRQYFMDGYYRRGAPAPALGFEPSAALVKAMLIASAVDLTELGCSWAGEVPSRLQGWGLVQLDRALLVGAEARRLLVADERERFTGSGDEPLRLEVTSGVPGPLKVVLAWTDPPSSSAATVNLVNDLDLVVEGPEGSFVGNHLVAGASEPGGEADRLNNVEVVWLPQAAQGRWTVEVRPSAIREPGQGFALVVVSPSAVAEWRRARRLVAP